MWDTLELLSTYDGVELTYQILYAFALSISYFYFVELLIPMPDWCETGKLPIIALGNTLLIHWMIIATHKMEIQSEKKTMENTMSHFLYNLYARLFRRRLSSLSAAL